MIRDVVITHDRRYHVRVVRADGHETSMDYDDVRQVASCIVEMRLDSFQFYCANDDERDALIAAILREGGRPN